MKHTIEVWRVHHNITKSVIPFDWNNVDVSEHDYNEYKIGDYYKL